MLFLPVFHNKHCYRHDDLRTMVKSENTNQLPEARVANRLIVNEIRANFNLKHDISEKP